MENATREIVDSAIDSLEDELEGLRRVPGWGIAVIVLVSFLSCVLGTVSCALFIAVPCYRAMSTWTTRLRATRLLHDMDDGNGMTGVEMPRDDAAIKDTTTNAEVSQITSTMGEANADKVFIVPPPSS